MWTTGHRTHFPPEPSDTGPISHRSLRTPDPSPTGVEPEPSSSRVRHRVRTPRGRGAHRTTETNRAAGGTRGVHRPPRVGTRGRSTNKDGTVSTSHRSGTLGTRGTAGVVYSRRGRPPLHRSRVGTGTETGKKEGTEIHRRKKRRCTTGVTYWCR